jgi:hypothetical protein
MVAGRFVHILFYPFIYSSDLFHIHFIFRPYFVASIIFQVLKAASMDMTVFGIYRCVVS